MWKYVSRRIRDTFERSVNHVDKISCRGLVNPPNGAAEESESGAPCGWFCSRKCTYGGDKNTDSKKWNFDQLHRGWIGAITWSSALVAGWYTSQLFHFKLKHTDTTVKKKSPCSLNNIVLSLYPYAKYVTTKPKCLEQITLEKTDDYNDKYTPIKLISNDHSGPTSSAKSVTEDSNSDLGEVLNSIENKLGLAAIENGQHQDGLNLLRSAANRNHGPALYNLGLCYEMGLGVPVDEKSAMELYRAAAAQQHPGALYNLGIYYGQGRGGLPRDSDTAMRLLKLAAFQGQQEAITALKNLEKGMLKSPAASSLGEESWFYNYSSLPQYEDMVPTYTNLYVENVNYSKSGACQAEVY